MPPAASFAKRWARDNLIRDATPDELVILGLFPVACEGNEVEASKRARRYYSARGPGGLELWHKRYPDDEDILSSCQDVYIVPLRTRSLSGRRLTILKLPAPTAPLRPLSVRAMFARWLMMLDIRLREDPTPGEEVVFIDVGELQPTHLKNHFRGTYWKDFVWCMKSAYPLRITEVHIINTQRLKTTTLILLHIGLYPWRRRVVQIHSDTNLADMIRPDRIAVDGLPFEYGGKAGAMKDLNDEWTKILLSNSRWLQVEERKFYETELKQDERSKGKRNGGRGLRGNIGFYDITSQSNSWKSLPRYDDLEEELHGAYRILKVNNDTVYT